MRPLCPLRWPNRLHCCCEVSHIALQEAPAEGKSPQQTFLGPATAAIPEATCVWKTPLSGRFLARNGPGPATAFLSEILSMMVPFYRGTCYLLCRSCSRPPDIKNAVQNVLSPKLFLVSATMDFLQWVCGLWGDASTQRWLVLLELCSDPGIFPGCPNLDVLRQRLPAVAWRIRASFLGLCDAPKTLLDGCIAATATCAPLDCRQNKSSQFAMESFFF